MKFFVMACVLFGAISAQIIGEWQSPIDTYCIIQGYYYGTCPETMRDLFNVNNSERCRQKIPCVGRSWIPLSYYIDELSTSTNGLPCGLGPNSTVQICNEGVCNGQLQLRNLNNLQPTTYYCEKHRRSNPVYE